MDTNLSNFTIDYQADSGANLLVLSQKDLDRSKLIDYQVEMIACNQIPGILNFVVREKNAEVSFQYNLKGYASLGNFLKRRQIKKIEFITLLERLISVLLESKRYLLSESSFVFDENLIYINPESLQVFLVYLPLEFSKDVIMSFKEFLINLIIYVANIESNGHFIEQILALLKKEDFTLLEFNQQLKKIKSSDYEEQHPVVDFDFARPQGQTWEPVDSDPSNSYLPNLELEQVPLKGRSRNQVKALPVFLGSLTVLLALAGLLTMQDNLAGYWAIIKGYSYLIVLGTLVICLLGVMLWNYSKSKAFHTEKRLEDQQKLQKIQVEMKKQAPVRYNVPQVAIEGQSVVALDLNPAPDSLWATQPRQFVDETVILNEHSGSVLKSVTGEEAIFLNKANLIIGRNAETCDCVIANKSVGRAHAQIKLVDSIYYIIDLDSRNGTFINGAKLVSNKQYALKNSDKVTFANAEYYFESSHSYPINS